MIESLISLVRQLDIVINEFFRSLVPIFPTIGLTLVNLFTNTVSPAIILIIGLIAVLYFLSTRHWRYAAVCLLSLGGGLLLNILLKNYIGRVRPLDPFIEQAGFSFPSGHATAAAIFFTLLIYLFVPKIKSMFWKKTLIATSFSLIILSAFSRVYLGVHWLSDVVAGVGFGVLWTVIIIFLLGQLKKYYLKEKVEARQFQ